MSNSEFAEKAIKDFFNAFNAHDNDAYQKTLHFPHIRINAAGNVNIWPDASSSTQLDIILTYLTEHEGWHHSSLDKVDLMDASDEKAHFKIRFTRYHEDGTSYAVHNSFWVITKKHNTWGIQARSSFAP